jgi:gamma-glutamyltranspeptidase
MTKTLATSASSKHGVVTAPHHLATAAGLDVLARGGNAIEAAIAAGAVLTVVYPHMNSMGGDAFFMIDDAKGGVSGLDGAGSAGARVTAAAYRERGHAAIPKRGPLAANTVAGMVSVWGTAFEQSRDEWGGTLSWAELLAPAIAMAEEGFPLNAGQPASLNGHWDALQHSPRFTEIFAPGGVVPEPGARFRQTALAGTMRQLAADGADSFYRGALGERIGAGLQHEGSLLDSEDLARFQCRRVAPLAVDYGDGSVINMPPPTVGMTALTILGILQRFDLSGHSHLSAPFIHLHVEAAKLAHQVRDRYLGDPDFVDVPVARLLSAEFLDELAGRIDLGRAAPFGQGGAPGDTVWFGVMDAQQRSVSAIQSLCWEYGSGVMAGDTGIVWHNRGHGFSLDPSHANCLEPNKRPAHTLIAPLYLEQGRARIVFGSMGGEGQPQVTSQVFTRAHDLGLPLDVAVAAPRWVIGRAWGDQSPTTLKLEHRFSDDVFNELAAMGHDVEWFPDYSDYMGHAGLIRLDDDGWMHAASDPRSDGAAGGVTAKPEQ